mgnify:FL=1
MKIEDLNAILKQNNYQKGGTLEACVKVREFLQGSIPEAKTVHSLFSCVTAEEFLEAVKVLMAFASQNPDTVPKRWHCSSDCCKCSSSFCQGECSLDKDSDNLCPYFQDESNK